MFTYRDLEQLSLLKLTENKCSKLSENALQKVNSGSVRQPYNQKEINNRLKLNLQKFYNIPTANKREIIIRLA